MQEKAKRSQRIGIGGMEFDDAYGWADTRAADTASDAKVFKDLTRLPGQGAASKDVPAATIPSAQQKRMGIGAKFGRLGGGGSGAGGARPKR